MAKSADDLQAEGEAQSASIMTQLMTLVNVSAAAPGKRKYSLIADDDADQDLSHAKARKSRRALLNASLNATSALPSSGPNSKKAVTSSDAAKTLEDAPTFEQAFGSTGPKAALAERFQGPSSKRFHLPWATQSRSDAKGAESLMVLEQSGVDKNGETREKVSARRSNLSIPGPQSSALLTGHRQAHEGKRLFRSQAFELCRSRRLQYQLRESKVVDRLGRKASHESHSNVRSSYASELSLIMLLTRSRPSQDEKACHSQQ